MNLLFSEDGFVSERLFALDALEGGAVTDVNQLVAIDVLNNKKRKNIFKTSKLRKVWSVPVKLSK